MPFQTRAQRESGKQQRIRDWTIATATMAEHPPIEAMQVSQETNSKRRHALSSMSESGRPVKCARISTVLLETPLLEDLSDAQTLEEDVSVTPQLKIEANLNPKRPRSLRPKKEQAPSKLKLMILEKPVYEASLGNNVSKSLPPDVAPLHRQLSGQWFGSRSLPDSDHWLEELHEIVLCANEAQRLLAHELSWNNLVHTPLLRLVFNARTQTTEENEAEEERLRQAVEPTQWRTKRLARARLVPTMTATISGEYIPRVRQPKPPRHPTDSTSPSSSVTSGPLACSVSAASAGTDDFVEVNSRSRSRKVDYVLAIDCAATT